jgi:chitin disaccharide deacetylase
MEIPVKRLIINADDLGADEGRNDGIFEALRAGVVTSASILPNGPALDHALAGIRSGGFEKVSFGVHLNLTEGKPLAEGQSCLTGPDGNFLGKGAAHRLLMKTRDLPLQKDIAREINLQIERLLHSAIGISHFDGHQHVHLLPSVLTTTAEIAGRHGIRRMRIPDEPIPSGDVAIPADLLEEAQCFSALGKAARVFLAGSAILAPDHFRGLLLKDRLTPQTLLAVIDQLPDGLTELMTHPGRVAKDAPFSPFSSSYREQELEALLDPCFKESLHRAGALLVSYRAVYPDTLQEN